MSYIPIKWQSVTDWTCLDKRSRRGPKTVFPCCDCPRSVSAFRVEDYKGLRITDSPLPTKLKPNSEYCLYCGYHIVYRGFEPGERDYVRRNSFHKKPITGVHVETGHVVHFDSKVDAVKSGFTTVAHCMKDMKPCKGYIFSNDKRD